MKQFNGTRQYWNNISVLTSDWDNFKYISLLIRQFDAQYNEFDVGCWSTNEKFIEYPDKRLKYDVLCMELSKAINKIQDNLFQYERAIEVFDEKQAEFNRINAEYKEFEKSLPDPLKTWVRSKSSHEHFGCFGL
jgi:vacuolar-type H+-ATPase subunit I/STV1